MWNVDGNTQRWLKDLWKTPNSWSIFWQGPNHKPVHLYSSKQKLIGRRKFSSQEGGGSCCWKSIRPFCRPHKKFHYSRILTWLKTQGISHFQKLIIFLTAGTVWLWLKIGQTCGFFFFFPFWWGWGRAEGDLTRLKTAMNLKHIWIKLCYQSNLRPH